MKRKWHHPEEDPNAKPLVRSLGELQDAAAYRERHELEFPKAVEEMRDEEDRDLSRRGFVKLMGASTALAGLGLAACRRPVGHIVPYAKSVEWIIPGKPLLYTTAMPRIGGCTPLLATTRSKTPRQWRRSPRCAISTGHARRERHPSLRQARPAACSHKRPAVLSAL